MKATTARRKPGPVVGPEFSVPAHVVLPGAGGTLLAWSPGMYIGLQYRLGIVIKPYLQVTQSSEQKECQEQGWGGLHRGLTESAAGEAEWFSSSHPQLLFGAKRRVSSVR